jgi:hypothetical protein
MALIDTIGPFFEDQGLGDVLPLIQAYKKRIERGIVYMDSFKMIVIEDYKIITYDRHSET